MNVDLREILKSFAHCQIAVLRDERLDDPAAVAGEVLRFVEALPAMFRDVIRLGAYKLDRIARRRTGRDFAALPLSERIGFLEGLERGRLPRTIRDLIAQIARLGWLVIHSRPAARDHVGFSPETGRPKVKVAPPPPADLDHDYDVCIVGSGAGGSVVAARLAEERPDLDVLLLEEGGFRSPDQLSSRDDVGLRDLYRDAGAQPAFSVLDALLDPEQAGFVNVLQGRVLGGGPFVNNAIHLDPESAALDEWEREWGFPVPRSRLAAALQRVQDDLNPNAEITGAAAGDRSHEFARAAERQVATRVDLLTNVLDDCFGCGACNLGCPYGHKIGGLGSGRAGRRASYLERAVRPDGSGVAVRTHFEVRRLLLKGMRTRSAWMLEGRDATRERRKVHLRARHFVLAAGPLASTTILQRTGARPERIQNPLGTRLSGNIVLPVFAVKGTKFTDDPLGNDPGLPMCYMVRTDGRPLLETWFHYPASLALGIPGWLRGHAALMRDYAKMAAVGVVVPSDNRGHVSGGLGGAHFSVDRDEYDRLLQGIAHIATIWFDAGAETIVPATRLPLVFDRNAGGFDRILARLRAEVRGPGDLTLSTAHPQGGNPIGRRPIRSVVAPDFRVFGLDNVTVADASLFPAGVRVNPQKTVMALAHLAAEKVMTAL